jgi:hypothetical protein
MPTISEPRTINATADALDDFRRMMWTFHDLARRAEKIQTLPEPYRALAGAIVKLSGLRPHIIVGEPEQDDFEKLKGDLDHIILAVDPLIKSYGDYAKANASGRFDTTLFTDQLLTALDGNAMFELTSAGERIAEDAADDGVPSIDVNREHRTHPGRA